MFAGVVGFKIKIKLTNDFVFLTIFWFISHACAMGLKVILDSYGFVKVLANKKQVVDPQLVSLG